MKVSPRRHHHRPVPQTAPKNKDKRQTETVRLFEVPNGYDFAVARHGRSFFYIGPNPAGPAREIRVVVNWLQELPTDNRGSVK